MNKKEICDKYFNGMNKKHLMEFEADTPQKNHIKGYICKKHNYFLGSLYITEVNGEKTGQFVQGFPKIHYPEPKNKYYTYEIDEYQESISLYEKIDGTNIVFYGLQNQYGGIIEIVPKTRNMPTADMFASMIKLLDLDPVKDIFDRYGRNTSVSVELYGVRNQHEIYYYDTYIKMVLLGIYYDNNYDKGFVSSCKLDKFNFGIERPKKLFTIKKDENDFVLILNLDNWLTRRYYEEYFYNRYTKEFCVTFDDIWGCFDTIKTLLQIMNKDYYEKHGHILLEGVVAFGQNSESHDFYTKIKPQDIENKHRNQNGVIPTKEIRKEIFKYFDEFGPSIKDLYNKDKNHYYNFIIENLAEDHTEEQMKNPQLRNRIEKIFFEYWESFVIPESLQKVCEKIVLDNPGRKTSELMRIFAQEYPEKKKRAKDVFKHMNAINKKYNGEEDDKNE